MDNNLNLARKWRSKNFNQIIGQDLSIKMLKNSLYLGHYFPVYLFSGQRGCGKTTTARVFAAALNCQELDAFQKNPKASSIPCLECASCIAMANAQHPDFFEIDAASHTGVDTIRQIIDSCQLLPLMGTKKIYLIDEAHMLSKASFNALLKILEEPPRSVLFILATTDDQKIIQTVKSRCFQLFFKSIASDPLIDHLVMLCKAEKINYDLEGLRLIIENSEGSARDAINLLEQVRFASGRINKEAVLGVLGHIEDEQIVRLFEIVLYNKPAELLFFLEKNSFESFSAEFIWTRFVEVARAALWIKHGIEPKQFVSYKKVIKRLVDAISWIDLNALLDGLYSNESVFLKTTAKYSLFEMILLQLCQKNRTSDGSAGLPNLSRGSQATSVDMLADDDYIPSDCHEETHVPQACVSLPWDTFIQRIHVLNDPLLHSVFKQGRVVGMDAVKKKLDVEFPKELSFFKDVLDTASPLWKPIFKEIFIDTVAINPIFNGIKIQHSVEKKSSTMGSEPQSSYQPIEKKAPLVVNNRVSANTFPVMRAVKSTSVVREPRINVSDSEVWPKATMLLHYFPGTISEVKEPIV